MTGAHAQVRQDPPQQLLVDLVQVGWGAMPLSRDQLDQARGQLAHRQHEVRDAGRDRAARHRADIRLRPDPAPG